MRSRFAVIFALVTMLFVPGCFGGGSSSNSPSGTMPVGARDASGRNGLYYSFDDILIPTELEVQSDESFVVEAGRIKSGVMAFEGSVELYSLKQYFLNNMGKDGWTNVSSFTSTRTLLVFEKPDRFCIINITDGSYDTAVEVWVSHRTGSIAPPARQAPAAATPRDDSFVGENGLKPLEAPAPIEEKRLSN